jgi:hypothetical protein
MSDVLNPQVNGKITKGGLPQALTCGNPPLSGRQDLNLRPLDPP